MLLQMGEVVQRRDLLGVTGQTKSLDQGPDVRCPGWGSFHYSTLFVPDSTVVYCNPVFFYLSDLGPSTETGP